MSLKKIVTAEGRSFIQSSIGLIDIGIKETVFSAICKVSSIQGGKTNLTVIVTCSGDGISYEERYSFQPSVEDGSVNFIKQAYNHLKTLPEFAGATDC